MSDTILSGDFTIYYLDENRQKRIEYTGSGTTYTVNELYSAIQAHFDASTTIDDGNPMKATTPTAYILGNPDAGDNDPWFIDHTSVEYLTGGALETTGWNRVEASNTGIILVECSTGASIVAADIGYTVTQGSGDLDSGTLLDVYDDGASTWLWIRPDTNASTDSFDDTSGIITSDRGAFTATQSAAGLTGDLLWPNIYNTGLATLQSNTHQYIDQNGSLLTTYKDTSPVSDWWVDGQFDILVQVKEMGVIGTGSSEINYGKIRVLARKPATGYAWFEVDLSAGGRNPIPLTSLPDNDNTTGFNLLNCSGGTGTFAVGDMIGETDSAATATKLGIITAVDNPGTDPDISYYPIGDPQVAFVNTDICYNIDGSGQADIDTVDTTTGPADATWYDSAAIPTIAFGINSSFDIDEDGTNEDYSVAIDLNQATLAEMWEFLKWSCRRGNSGDIDGGAQTVAGQFYRGLQRKFEYTFTAGTFTEGDAIYFYDGSDVLTAIGVLQADQTTLDEFMMREYIVVGTEGNITKFCDQDTWSTAGTYGTIESNTTITPVQKCPFGDFAGGTFFGADGVLIHDYKTSEENSFQLKDNQGTLVEVPTKIALAIANTRVGDFVGMFRTDSNYDIIRDAYNSHAANNSQGDLTFEVDGTPSIATDEPGKSTGGVVRVFAVDEAVEHRYRFTGWDGDVFTLATASGTDEGGGDQTTIVDTGIEANAKVGDIVFNSIENTYAYITAVTTDQVTTTNVGSDAPVTSWAGDTYTINGLVQTYDGSDAAWVPLLDAYEDTGSDGSPGSESTSLVKGATIYLRVVARNAAGANKILPYAATGSITATANYANSVIRAEDAISSN